MSDEAIEEWNATGTIDKDEPITTSTLEERFPDVDVPHLSALVELLYRTGMEIRNIEYVDATPYVDVGLKGQEWLILNDDEADEKAREEVEKMLDSDLNSLPSSWKEFVNNGDDFTNLLAEKVMEYIDAIREEPADDMGTTELDKEMQEAGLATEEEFADYIASKWVPSGDATQWYVDEYGDQAFRELADIDVDSYINHIIINEGRGAILSEDGDELNLGHGYYAYQIG